MLPVPNNEGFSVTSCKARLDDGSGVGASSEDRACVWVHRDPSCIRWDQWRSKAWVVVEVQTEADSCDNCGGDEVDKVGMRASGVGCPVFRPVALARNGHHVAVCWLLYGIWQ